MLEGLGRFVLTIPCTFLKAYVLSMLWMWFITPATGLPEIGMALVYGVYITVKYFTLDLGDKLVIREAPTESKFSQNEETVICYIVPLLVLGIGYITTLFL